MGDVAEFLEIEQNYADVVVKGQQTPQSVQGHQPVKNCKLWRAMHADATQNDGVGWGQRGQSLKSKILETPFSIVEVPIQEEYNINDGQTLEKVFSANFWSATILLKNFGEMCWIIPR